MKLKCLVGMFCVLAISSPVISDDSANKNPEESAADGVGKRAASDHSFPQKLMQIFQPGQTATLYSTTTGYNIRLVTDEQRKKVAKTIADYRKIREENIEDEMFVNRVTTAYRTLASDLRLGRYYKELATSYSRLADPKPLA